MDVRILMTRFDFFDKYFVLIFSNQLRNRSLSSVSVFETDISSFGKTVSFI